MARESHARRRHHTHTRGVVCRRIQPGGRCEEGDGQTCIREAVDFTWRHRWLKAKTTGETVKTVRDGFECPKLLLHGSGVPGMQVPNPRTMCEGVLDAVSFFEKIGHVRPSSSQGKGKIFPRGTFLRDQFDEKEFGFSL